MVDALVNDGVRQLPANPIRELIFVDPEDVRMGGVVTVVLRQTA